MSKIILALFLILVSINAWSVNLEKKSVQVDGDAGEDLYVHKVNFGTKEDPQLVHTVFDLTSESNWVLDKNTCKDCTDKSKETFDCKDAKYCEVEEKLGGVSHGFADQLQFTSQDGKEIQNSFKQGTDTLEFAGKEWRDVKLQFPVNVSNNGNPKQDLLQTAQASVGLGKSEKSFQHHLNKKDKDTDDDSFSLYLGDLNVLMFGQPQEFFKKGEWKTMKSANSEQFDKYRQSHAVQIKAFHVDDVVIGVTQNVKNDVKNNNINKNKEQYGVFSSTSKYIYFEDKNLLDAIVYQMKKSAGISCERKENQTYYLCDKAENYPTLKVQFTEGDHTFELHKEDYTEKVEGLDDKVMLLLRLGTYGQQNYQLAMFGAQEYFVWLGYPFFQKHYVNFNYNEDIIQVSDKYHFDAKSYLKIDRNSHLAFLILGVIGALFAVTVILLTLKAVPFNASQRYIIDTNRSTYPNYPPGSPVRYTGSPKRFVPEEDSPSQAVPPYQYMSNFVNVNNGAGSNFISQHNQY